MSYAFLSSSKHRKALRENYKKKNKERDKKKKETKRKKGKIAINVKYPFLWSWSTVRKSYGQRMEAGCYRIVITSNQSDRWVLERSARFHAADGLAVCVSVCVLIRGPVACLMGCIGMAGVYLSMCPLILHFWGEIEFALGGFKKMCFGIFVRSMYLSVHKRFCVMYVCKSPKPPNPETHIKSLILCDKILSL